MRLLHSKIFYLIVFLIIDIALALILLRKDNTKTSISVDFFVFGNNSNNGCLSVYVNDNETNEYSFDNGTTWQKSKYGAVYENGETNILVRDKNKSIIFEKTIDINNIDTSAPAIKLDFDDTINNKSNSELLKGVSVINGDIAKVKTSILEDKNNKLLVVYKVENGDKKCHLLREVENKNTEEEVKNEWVWPTDKSYQISRGVSSSHNGVDIYGPARGTKIYAARDGEIVDIGVNSSSGYYVIIKHDNGYYTRYGHMQNTDGNDTLNRKSSATKYISIGQSVKAHDPIGEVGSSGYSTAIHIHFEVWDGIPYKGKVLNPLSFYTKGVNR